MLTSLLTAITTQTRASLSGNIYSLARTLFYSFAAGHLTGLSKGELTEDKVSEGVKEARKLKVVFRVSDSESLSPSIEFQFSNYNSRQLDLLHIGRG